MPASNSAWEAAGPDEERREADARLVALMLRVREDGDEEAFRELVTGCEDRVMGTIVRMLGGWEGAEDLAQRVFLRVWEARRHYEPRAMFGTWLHAIVRNLVLNELRGRRRRAAVFSPVPSESGAWEHPSPQAGPADEAAAAEVAAAIEKAIAGLPEEQRLALVLRRYEEMPYEEIAKVMELSLPAVKSLLFRARAALRLALAEYLEG